MLNTSKKFCVYTIYAQAIHDDLMYVKGVLIVAPFKKSGHKCFDRSGHLL